MRCDDCSSFLEDFFIVVPTLRVLALHGAQLSGQHVVVTQEDGVNYFKTELNIHALITCAKTPFFGSSTLTRSVLMSVPARKHGFAAVASVHSSPVMSAGRKASNRDVFPCTDFKRPVYEKNGDIHVRN